MSNDLTTLPAELIYRILDYIPTLEILLLFCSVNKHLRSLALAYPRLRPDFNRTNIIIDKKLFDGICMQLQRSISQIVSLTLFNPDDPLTPMKNALFLSRFTRIDQTFSNLHSLTLTYIDYDAWCLFKDRISSPITSLSIHLVHVGQRANASLTLTILTEILLFSLSIERLSIKMSNYSNQMIPISFRSGLTLPFLRYFRSKGISIDVSGLSVLAPQLHTLEFHQPNENIKLNFILFSSPHLQRLRLELRSLLWTEIELVFSSFPRLNHLTVIADDARNKLANGSLWATMLKGVKSFHMNLSFGPDVFSRQSIDLESFRTRFWLEEKKWLVTYQRNSNNGRSILYTNPSPINNESISTIVGILPSESTPTPSVHCMAINYLHFKRVLLHCSIHLPEIDFSNGSTSFPSTFRALIAYLDTRNVRPQWIQKSSNELIEFLCSQSYVHALSVSVAVLKYLYAYQWSYITDLKIENDLINGYQLSSSEEIDALCQAFPYVERLDIHSTSTTVLPQILQRMKNTLIDVVIRQSLVSNQEQQLSLRQSIEENIERTDIHYVCDRMNSLSLWL